MKPLGNRENSRRRCRISTVVIVRLAGLEIEIWSGTRHELEVFIHLATDSFDDALPKRGDKFGDKKVSRALTFRLVLRWCGQYEDRPCLDIDPQDDPRAPEAMTEVAIIHTQGNSFLSSF